MKTIVITGASSGIGAQLVELASRKNWQVLMVARREDRLSELAEKKSNCLPFPCDLSQASAVESLCEKLSDFEIHALVNNAGIFKPGNFQEDHDKIWEEHFQVNLMSAVRLTRGLWESLKETQGAIVNVSSTLAIRPVANTVAYSALKAAMNNWSLSLAQEGAPFGIRCNVICPGIVETPIHGFYQSEKAEDKKYYQEIQSAQPLGRTGRVEDIAPGILHLCGEDSQWTTGSIINIDGGILLNS